MGSPQRTRLQESRFTGHYVGLRRGRAVPLLRGAVHRVRPCAAVAPTLLELCRSRLRHRGARRALPPG
eukprot:11569226-Alexandrium_andersonii.AAC.1